MAKLAELSRLFHAISARDWRVAQALALEVAKAEAARGNHAAATRLRGALKPNGTRNGAPDNGPTLEPASAVGILTELPPQRGLESVSLHQRQRTELQALLKEWHLRDKLQHHGVRRRSKILFYGPPGCGKSMAAGALAREASLPAYVVQLDAVMGAFLGQTALRIRELFRFAEAAPSVLLLDEIDALGRERGNAMDVGELDRVVISVMQHLEHSEPAGLLIATSNLPSHLDRALVRRFDLKLEFPAPAKTEHIRFGASAARARGVILTKGLKVEIAESKSFADIERIVSDEKRRKLLNGG